MSYPLQRKYKTEWPTPEEEQVLQALKDYCFDPEKTAVTDFVPTRVLYGVYLKFVDQYDFTAASADFPDKLDEKQFGAALRRVFHLEDDRQTRRRIGGRLTMGYFYVKGPASITVNNGPGNPSFKRKSVCTIHSTEKIDSSTNTLVPLALAAS